MSLLFLVVDTGQGVGVDSADMVSSTGALGGLLVGYFFAISRRPHVGGTLLVLVPIVAIWMMRLVGGEAGAILYFLALPLMIAPFAIPLRAALWIFSTNFLALIVAEPSLEFVRGQAIDLEIHLVLASFVGIVSALALIAARAVETDLATLERSQNELRVANERLQDLDRNRLQFVNNVAHDLASPIHPVKLQLAVLDAMPEITGEQKQKSLAIMHRNIDQFERLLTDLRDVAKLEAGRLPLQLQDVDLALVVAQSCEGFSGTASERGIRLECHASGPLHAFADPQRLTQVLYNFITNALKFTPKGGSVQVSSVQSSSNAEIRVADTGRGLTPGEREKLFRPFSQVHDPSQYKERGTGLGLFICKGVVEAHGGSIGVFSDGLGQGSTFWFTVPLRDAHAAASADQGAPAAVT